MILQQETWVDILTYGRVVFSYPDLYYRGPRLLAACMTILKEMLVTSTSSTPSSSSKFGLTHLFRSSITAIFNLCASAHLCDARSPQVCRSSLGAKVEKKRENFRNRKLSKSVIKIILKNNTLIRILAIELLNRTLLLVFSDKVSP
jgi:hypothetical protein